MGANPLTLSGLAGQGDLIATCSSKLSRNHQVGERLTRGESLKDIQASMNGIAEGVTTTLAAWNLAQKLGIEMPIDGCTECCTRAKTSALPSRN